MEIEEYLLKKRKKLEKQAKKIRDFTVFDFNYIPEKPLMREETKPVIDSILRYERTGIPNNILIFGSRGSGKTLTIKYLMRLFEQKSKLTMQYANCRTFNTSFKIVANLLGMKARGTSLSELYQKFEQRFTSRTVVVLDEVDLLSEKDRGKDILYFLSRSSIGYMAILLSNNPKFLNEIDESTRSTLQPEIIHFKNYNALQINSILRQRAENGLTSFNDRLLGKIAALTTRHTNSDVRVAIKTLFYCVTEPERGIEENFERARRDIFVDVINDLNDSNLLILKASQEEKTRYVKAIYEKYRKLSVKEGEKPISYVYFYNNLSYLQSLGLIILISAKVNRAYTNKISLLFNEEIIDTIYRIRFGK